MGLDNEPYIIDDCYDSPIFDILEEEYEISNLQLGVFILGGVCLIGGSIMKRFKKRGSWIGSYYGFGKKMHKIGLGMCLVGFLLRNY